MVVGQQKQRPWPVPVEDFEINIEFCQGCEFHQLTTKHDPRKYNGLYARLHELITGTYPRSRVIANFDGAKASRFGAFEVVLRIPGFDQIVVFSKLQRKKFPSEQVIMATLEDLLGSNQHQSSGIAVLPVETSSREIPPITPISQPNKSRSQISDSKQQSLDQTGSSNNSAGGFDVVSVPKLGEEDRYYIPEEVSELDIILGWNGDADLDGSCVMFDSKGAVIESVFYNHLESSDGAVIHLGDEHLDDGYEALSVYLDEISPACHAILFVLDSRVGHDFTEIHSSYVRVQDKLTMKSLVHYPMHGGKDHTAQVMLCLHRSEDQLSWVLRAVGTCHLAEKYDDLLPMMQVYMRDSDVAPNNYVFVSYCDDCDNHQLTTSHRKEVYYAAFEKVKRKVAKHFPRMVVVGNPDKPHIGAFEIDLKMYGFEKMRVYSKIDNGRFPSIDFVLDRIGAIVMECKKQGKEFFPEEEEEEQEQAKQEPSQPEEPDFQESQIQPQSLTLSKSDLGESPQLVKAPSDGLGDVMEAAPDKPEAVEPPPVQGDPADDLHYEDDDDEDGEGDGKSLSNAPPSHATQESNAKETQPQNIEQSTPKSAESLKEPDVEASPSRQQPDTAEQTPQESSTATTEPASPSPVVVEPSSTLSPHTPAQASLSTPDRQIEAVSPLTPAEEESVADDIPDEDDKYSSVKDDDDDNDSVSDVISSDDDDDDNDDDDDISSVNSDELISSGDTV